MPSSLHSRPSLNAKPPLPRTSFYGSGASAIVYSGRSCSTPSTKQEHQLGSVYTNIPSVVWRCTGLLSYGRSCRLPNCTTGTAFPPRDWVWPSQWRKLVVLGMYIPLHRCSCHRWRSSSIAARVFRKILFYYPCWLTLYARVGLAIQSTNTHSSKFCRGLQKAQKGCSLEGGLRRVWGELVHVESTQHVLALSEFTNSLQRFDKVLLGLCFGFLLQKFTDIVIFVVRKQRFR